VGLGATYLPTQHHVQTLATTSSWPNPETIAAHEVLAHPHAMFYPCTYGLRGGAAALIGYNDMGLLLRQPQAGDGRDRLLPLHRCVTMMDRCSTHLVVTIHDVEIFLADTVQVVLV
jgi:hypothetical protein